MFSKSKYRTALKILLIISIIAIVGILVITGYKMYNSYYITTGALKAVSTFEQALKSGKSVSTKYKEYTVIGIIDIPTIKFKYPILQENDINALETSAVLMYTAQGLNNSGNSVIMGHNYKNGTIFSDLDKLAKRDYIYIKDNTGRELKYEIYNIYTLSDDDNSYITRNTNGKTEISLITNTNDGKSKIVVLAREE